MSRQSGERRAATVSTVPPSAAAPGPHPDPPRDLAIRPLPLTILRTGTSWTRIYPLAFSPDYFDTSDRHRLNAPAGQFGTLYAGNDDACAFIETFGRDLDLRVVAHSDLATRGRSRVEIRRELRVVDLTGPGLAQIRADGRLTTGDYRVAQKWSLAMHQHPDEPDGLIWPSRFDPSRVCLAVYDRARTSIQTVPIGSLTDRSFASDLAAILDRYGIALI
jgi:hypothetical protein